jgi:hypothetical protein
VPDAGSRHPHAKLYYFDGPDGDAAIVGSANCSAAAWVVPAARGGNVEIAVLYDRCDQNDFEESLGAVLAGERKELSELHDLGELVGEATVHDNHRPVLTGLSASFSVGLLRAELAKAPAAPATAEVVLGGTPVTVTSDESGKVWTGVWVGPPPHAGTLFGEFVIRQVADEVRSEPRWLDDEDALLHAARGRGLSDPLRRLGAPATSAEQRQIIQDLAWISQHLLDGKSAFPDPQHRTKRTEDAEAGEAEPVDPDALVSSLEDVETRHGRSALQGSGWGLPIVGVMHAFFPERHAEQQDLVVSEDDKIADEATNGSKTEPTPEVNGVRTPPPPETLRMRLQKQIDRYLARLAEPEFRAGTTATQFVQAMSYPLAVAAFGVRRGWVARASAADWVVRVCDLLFRLPIRDGVRCEGLLEAVHHRFREAGDERLYLDVVGDGTLWVALVGALCAVPWDGPHAHLDRALTLRDVFRERRLFATATVGRLHDLLARLKIEQGNRDVLSEARRVSSVLSGLEGRLVGQESEFRAAQIGRDHQVDDPLFRSQVGFARARETVQIHDGHKLKIYIRSRADVKKVVANYYVNVRLAGDLDPEVAVCLGGLSPA